MPHISKLAKEIIDSFSELAEQNQIHLETDIYPEIMWKSDYSGFTKILNNLISNAFKYTPENGIIRISIKAEGDKLNLKVYNTGKGYAKRVFHLYLTDIVYLIIFKRIVLKGFLPEMVWDLPSAKAW